METELSSNFDTNLEKFKILYLLRPFVYVAYVLTAEHLPRHRHVVMNFLHRVLDILKYLYQYPIYMSTQISNLHYELLRH